MEEIGPQMIPATAGLSDNVKTSALDEAADSPDVIVINPLNEDNNGATEKYHRHSPPAPLLTPVKSDPKDSIALPKDTPRFEESLTQPSTAPASQHSRTTPHTPAAHPCSISQNSLKFGNEIPMSQQSLTQPSSTLSLSPAPARVPEDTMHSFTKKVARPTVFAIDSPIR